MSRYAQLHKEYVEWKMANRDALIALCDVINQKIMLGATKWSVAAAFEVVVWERAKLKVGGSEFKMPHNHRAFFAREWMEHYGDQHPKFFQVCRQRSAGEFVMDRFGREEGGQRDAVSV